MMNDDAIRFGEVDLSTCDREPIHIPGSIQPHGALLVVDRQTLEVEQTAGDTKQYIGIEPQIVINMPLSAILDSDTMTFIHRCLNVPSAFVAPNMRLGAGSRTSPLLLDLTLHAMDRTVIIELEPAERTLTSAGDPIAQLKTLLSAVQLTASAEECCAAAAVAMRAATGFDRAMVYRFLPDGSGVVAAEDACAGLESFLGLHYPASDIPKQARELYRRNWLRAIPNIDYAAAPLQPSVNSRTLRPIDMSHCDLRSVSPIHLEYLRNMGVCASLSASIICRDQLWGMLVLHHYSPRHVSADLRVACETFAQILSLHIEAKEQEETSLLRKDTHRLRDELAANLAGAADIGRVLAEWDLLNYVGASGAVVYLDGHLHVVGETPAAADIVPLLQWLNGVNRPLCATDHFSSEYPPAASFAAIASGMMSAGLSRIPRDYVVWFRPEIGRTVRWAGDPSKPTKVDRHGARLTPRGSFAEWLEVTRMHSAPWSELDLEAAEALRVVLLENVLKNVDLVRREREIQATRAMTEELERRVAQRTEQLRSLAADLEAVEERERRQIARDLHDDFGQTLAAARIRLTSLCNDERREVRHTADQVGELIDRANSAIRSLAAQLAPDVLHELGLSAALEWLGEEIERTFGLKVAIIDDGLPKPLAQEARSILYRAARELLINVAKHAETDSATVECECRDRRILVRISDRGVGYDSAAPSEGRQRGLGLLSVRERLPLIGGTAEMRSVPGGGTVATLTAPLAADETRNTDRRS
jgi:light-regulated signal transduction histidine kinase (bacteriophytochrome)